MDPENVTLLLTASIIPVPGIERVGLTRINPAEREQDYIDGLTYFLTNHPRVRRIVFVENSGASLDRLREAADKSNPHGKDVEFVSTNSNNYPSGFGGGYGEWTLMSRAFAESRLLASSKYFAKMTGRQWLLNLTRILRGLPDSADFMGDTQNTSFYRRLGLSEHGRNLKIDARFWVTTPAFYDKYIRNLHLSHKEGIFFAEGTLFNAVTAASKDNSIVWRFPVVPACRGIAGHMNKDYGALSQRLKRGVRVMFRTIAPGIWI